MSTRYARRNIAYITYNAYIIYDLYFFKNDEKNRINDEKMLTDFGKGAILKSQKENRIKKDEKSCESWSWCLGTVNRGW